MKKRIRITESELHNIVKKCVNEALNEIGDTERGQYALGCVQARNDLRMQQNKGNSQQFRKYSNASDNTANVAHNSRAAINGGSEWNQNNMDTYNKAKDMYNANQQGYRNYMSSMNDPSAPDYRTQQIRH